MKRKRNGDEENCDSFGYSPIIKKRKLDSSEMRKEDVPSHLMRYWYTRYYRFSKFDEGLLLNMDCLSESTYEEIARHVSNRVTESLLVGSHNYSEGITILDAMCGSGNSTIQFALNPNVKKVIAVEIRGEKIEFAKHNCQIYGVDTTKIEFYEDDIFNFLSKNAHRYRIDACLLSPPWGGVDYKNKMEFSLDDVQFKNGDINNVKNGITLFNETIKNVTRNIAYSLPLNTSRKGFEKLNYRGTIEEETNYFNNKRKTKTFYFGDLVTRRGKVK